MKVSVRIGFLLPVAFAALVPASAAVAAPGPARTSWSLERDGIVLEVSAPRADIVRVRAGRGHLPEDASWAVLPASRASRVPLEVREQAGLATIRTGALVVEVERATLHVRVKDAQGEVILEDAPGDALAIQGPRLRLRKSMPRGWHYFGLGDKAGPLDRRDQAFTLWNTDAFGFQTHSDPLYKSVPFVVAAGDSGRSFGLFFDNTWRSFFDFGKSERDVLAFGAEGGPVDYYVLGGPAPRDVVQGYAWLTGNTPLPPLWSLGFQQSRYSYATEGELRGIASRLRADRIPADVLYMDIDYQDRNRPFTVDPLAFPDLPRMFADLRAQGFRVVMITDLHIAHVTGAGYAPYDSGHAIDAFVKRPDGTDYVGIVWPGESVFPDFSRPAVRTWWGGLYADFLHRGAGGFWNDMNEPAVFQVEGKTMPLDIVHRIEEPGFAPRNASHAEMHNVYGMLNSRGTYEGLLRIAPDQRPFVLTRASYAGGQRYAATWTGDNSSSWSHLALSTRQLANLGLSGFAMSGDDIGGFAGEAPSPELLTRWFEIGAFNPVFRDHACKGKEAQEPWVGGPEQEAIRRRYVEERYRLMPYLYATADEMSRTGLPILRPLFLDFPAMAAQSGARDAGDREFLFGPDLLVAPSPTGESPSAYDIRLPGPGWTDYWTGERVAGDTVREVPRLERMPVYVRPGAILARQPLVQNTSEAPSGPLQVSVYPGDDCAGHLYLDDGETMGYQRGEFLRQEIRCEVAGPDIVVRFRPRQGRFHPWWSRIDLEVRGWTAATARVEVDGTEVPSRVDPAAHSVHVVLPDQSGAATLRFLAPR